MSAAGVPDSGPADLVRRGHYIGGEWVEPASGTYFLSRNPSTGEPLAMLAEGGVEDIDRAVVAARTAFEGPWSRFTPRDRQRLLLRLAEVLEANLDELRAIDVSDMGMPITRSASIADAIEVLRYYAGWATKLHGRAMGTSVPGVLTYTSREPVGVVGGIFAWNGPLGAIVWKLAPALAAGCTMVMKPSEEASLSPLRLAELLKELDLPPGVVNIVTGYGHVAGARLSEHPDVDHISFTGSPATGRVIVRAAASNLKRVSLELGGKSPNVIFADADLDKAVVGAANGVFDNTGQMCIAGSRIYVERSVHEEFVERLASHAQGLRVGLSTDPATELGPVVSKTQLERVLGYVDAGVSEGARLVTGGAQISEGGLADGYFVEPAVFAGVEDHMKIAREEIFGPVASVLAFDDFDEVLERANATSYGLASGVWTSDMATAHRFASTIRAGVVWVNTYGEFDPSMPFGGFKQSGWGKELGEAALDGFLDEKAVWIRTDV